MTAGEFYLFALFVFALLLVLLLLYWRLIVIPRGRKPKNDDVLEKEREKEERLFRLYQNIEEMMDNFEGYIEDTREQMESLKAESARQADKAAELLRRVETTEAKAIAAVAALRPKERPEPSHSDQEAVAKPQDGKRGAKQDAIRDLLNKGMTVEQIAQKLELSINEVRLVVYGLMSKKN